MTAKNNLTQPHIVKIMQDAKSAFHLYKKTTSEKRAEFLFEIANEIELLGDNLVQTAMKETNLPEARIVSERGRTCGQLRQFADMLLEGSWVNASIDMAKPNRTPIAKPDLRKMNIALGTVVVFGAGNFPLAYSTAGGDTASALAVGCSVVVKGHPEHQETSQLVADAIITAAEKTKMPNNVFQHISASSFDVGKWLVQDDNTEAVAFTGSFIGGTALLEYAKQRQKPIPIFAEMGSVNPVVMLPNAVKEMSNEIAKTMAASITNGMGQFCTNPGLIFCLNEPGTDHFIQLLGKNMKEVVPQKMLNDGISKNYYNKRDKMLNEKGIRLISVSSIEAKSNEGFPTLAEIDGATFIGNSAIHEEVFGPFSIIVRFDSVQQLKFALEKIPGQLTGSLWATERDLKTNPDLLDAITNFSGRVIINGAPTGVEVCPSMVHGGPFPATTDPRFTSVGLSAIQRFVRPICFQNVPNEFLPNELKNENPNHIWRLVNNQLTKDKTN